MRTRCVAPVELHATALAATMALSLSGPVYAADPAPNSPQAAADRTSVSEAKPADNTARNARDAADNELTPLDQTKAETDVEVTRSVRHTLVDDDTLVTNAQNVKVISVDGTVTLRGAVASPDEHARIVAIAKKAVGTDRVVDELEVITR